MRKIKKQILISFSALLSLAPLAAIAQWDPANYSTTNLPAGRVYDIIFNILFWLLAIFGAVGIIGFVISGILYLTAAGNEEQITKAKSAMKWSLVGVVVGLAGLVILRAATTALGGFFYF
ncbi:MAG: hypothetical protein NT136_00765 [Candidatus Moranbacteria bacterium]|nr:hypothetical protein [Candidatus Moranbacteria bacterium]